MDKEKKLTDEEIVKALDCCRNNDCKCCPLGGVNCNALVCETYVFEKTVDLIHRLQDEIERLKKRHGVALLRNDDLDLENYELKKQVEEMKADITKVIEDYKNEMPKALEEAEKKIEEMQQQAVKDTAKAVITDMFKQIEGYEAIDIVLNQIAERYGVEVE